MPQMIYAKENCFMKPDSIIFDIDGTLWNSTPLVAKAWNTILEERSDVPIRFTPEELTRLFGRPLPVIADMVFSFLEPDDRYTLINRCCELEHQMLRVYKENLLYPQVAETIRTLSARMPLFIVSNCQSGYIELFLKKTGLGGCVTDFECPGNTGKPKGENIRLVVDRNHLKAPVYVGDILGDQEASLQAGVPFCHAAYGFGEVPDPDYVIHHFSELLTIF